MTCGLVGTAISRNISTAGAALTGTRSKPKACARLAYISGNGRRVTNASCGRSMRTGMRIGKRNDAENEWPQSTQRSSKSASVSSVAKIT